MKNKEKLIKIAIISIIVVICFIIGLIIGIKINTKSNEEIVECTSIFAHQYGSGATKEVYTFEKNKLISEEIVSYYDFGTEDLATTMNKKMNYCSQYKEDKCSSISRDVYVVTTLNKKKLSKVKIDALLNSEDKVCIKK